MILDLRLQDFNNPKLLPSYTEEDSLKVVAEASNALKTSKVVKSTNQIKS